MEKKTYEELDLTLVRFTAEDVIATSGEESCDPDCQGVKPCASNVCPALTTKD